MVCQTPGDSTYHSIQQRCLQQQPLRLPLPAGLASRTTAACRKVDCTFGQDVLAGSETVDTVDLVMGVREIVGHLGVVDVDAHRLVAAMPILVLVTVDSGLSGTVLRNSSWPTVSARVHAQRDDDVCLKRAKSARRPAT